VTTIGHGVIDSSCEKFFYRVGTGRAAPDVPRATTVVRTDEERQRPATFPATGS
jgi:hypothetical protein